MASQEAHESGGFIEGSPAEQKAGAGQLAEPKLGRFGQGRYPVGHSPEQDLLHECTRLVLRVPLAEMMGFASGQSEHRLKGFVNAVLRRRGEFPGHGQASFEAVDSVGVDEGFPGGDVFERLGNATSTGVAELAGFGLGRESGGEFADEPVQADAVLQELLDEPDVVQTLQCPP